MVSLEQALAEFNQIKGLLRSEKIPLLDALGRVLAVPVRSQVDHPPFDKSAMDGFAISSCSGGEGWRLGETIAAGQVPTRSVETGTCSKIMTGAMLPHGAEAVVMVEHAEVIAGVMRQTVGHVKAGDNICRRGEDARTGDIVANVGARISPQLIGCVAACGWHEVDVFVRPRLAVLTTGDEIVLPGQPLAAGQIYNSNAFSLISQYRAMGVDAFFAGVVGDEPSILKEKIAKTLHDVDVLIISGGVSMGDFDFVPRAISELGGTIHFAKVAVKPGKPTLFATLDKRLIFGLPGNPVSTFIITEILVKPALARLMNLHEQPHFLTGTLSATVGRKKADRTAFIPVRCQDGQVEVVEYHGSAHLLALPLANGLIVLERGISTLPKGSEVRVRLF